MAMMLWAPDSDAYSLNDFYGRRLLFSAKGEPLVSVGMMQKQKEVVVLSEEGLIVEVGEAGPSMTLPANTELVVRWLGGTAAPVKRMLVVETLSHAERSTLDEVKHKWFEKGVSVEFKVIGGVYGVQNTHLDNRETLVLAQGKQWKEKEIEEMGGQPWWYEELSGLPQMRISISHPNFPAITLNSQKQSPVIRIVPLRSAPVLVKKVEHGIGYHFHGFADRLLRGEVIILPDRYGTLAVVNVVPEDILVAGILPAEMFASAPMEALKAQAVTARGEVFAKVGKRHLADPFLLCSEQHCQVYKGKTAEHPRTNRAAQETKGQLAFLNGRLVDSVYSACCGGHTEANHEVWDQRPSSATVGRFDGVQMPVGLPGQTTAFHPKGLMAQPIKPHIHPRRSLPKISERLDLRQADHVRTFLELPKDRTFCGKSSFNQKGDVYRWRRVFPVEKVNALIKPLKIGQVRDLKVLERGHGGRVKRLQITGDQGQKIIRRELPVRRLFSNLRSGLFVLERERDAEGNIKAFIFQGGGFGHGSGMCQQGAIGMAEADYGYGAILEHYYNGARVKKVF